MIQNLTNVSKTIIISSMTLVIISLLFSPYEVNGRSMQPTLEDGDKVLVLRLNYINLPIIDQKIIINQPKKDSIIAFKKKNSETELIKRVIGLPNEEIDIKNRTVFIDGIIQEQGIGVTNPNSDFPIMVDENCVFVLIWCRFNILLTFLLTSWILLTFYLLFRFDLLCYLFLKRH